MIDLFTAYDITRCFHAREGSGEAFAIVGKAVA